MKITQIAISNILSFQHKENFAEEDKISFHDNLNILIGPNGAGKSNFLEIINRALQFGLFKRCEYNENALFDYERRQEPKILKNTLSFSGNQNHQLIKNRQSSDNSIIIELKIKLNNLDKQNIFFLRKNAEKINEYFLKYSNTAVSFNDTVTKTELENISDVSLRLKSDMTGNILGLDNHLNDTEKFIYMYLQWFFFIQIIIEIANQREGTSWPRLKNTFSWMGSNRSFHDLEAVLSMKDPQRLKEQLREREISEGVKSNIKGEPLSIFKTKLFIVEKIFQKEKENLNTGIDTHGKPIIQLIDTPVLENINKKLSKYLKINLKVEKVSHTDYSFNFFDENLKIPIQISDLSSGEKEILHLIFAIYGNNMENGMMIIDEPELHIHPNLQQKVLGLIQESIIDLKMQFIIATHSPVFVNEKTIDSLMRFYQENNYTKVVKLNNIPVSMRNKIRLLDYTNSSIIFFNEKIVLLEGYPDKLFFKIFLENYEKRKNRKIENLEFLDMGPSGEYTNWKNILDKFKIKTYLLADADNLKLPFVSSNSQKWLSIFPSNMLYKEIQDLKQSNNVEYTNLLTEIKNLYNQNIHLFENGSFENCYLLINNRDPSTESKPSPDEIINFCINNLDNWITQNQNHPIVKEIDGMFDNIIK